MADKLLISRYLDTAGDGSGTKNAIGNYAAEEQFYIQANEADVLVITRLIVTIEDAKGIKPELYGSNAALANGIQVQVRASDETVLMDLTDGIPVKSNALWGSLCWDVLVQDWTNNPTNEVVGVRWTFSKSGVDGITLEGGQKLVVLLEDNLSGLVKHYFMAQGFYMNKGY